MGTQPTRYTLNTCCFIWNYFLLTNLRTYYSDGTAGQFDLQIMVIDPCRSGSEMSCCHINFRMATKMNV